MQHVLIGKDYKKMMHVNLGFILFCLKDLLNRKVADLRGFLVRPSYNCNQQIADQEQSHGEERQGTVSSHHKRSKSLQDLQDHIISGITKSKV